MDLAVGNVARLFGSSALQDVPCGLGRVALETEGNADVTLCIDFAGSAGYVVAMYPIESGDWLTSLLANLAEGNNERIKRHQDDAI